MKKTIVWYKPTNGGDSSAGINWYLTKEEAEWVYDNEYEPFAEDGINSAETFEGSDIHNEAIKTRQEVQKAYYFKDKDYKERFGDDYMTFYKYILTEEEEKEVGMKFLEMKGDPDE